MKPVNVDVKRKIKKSGLYQYEVADMLGKSESQFCRMLRKELSEEIKQDIYTVIQGKKEAESNE
jgi:predicted XRE-type DNA-binding protein